MFASSSSSQPRSVTLQRLNELATEGHPAATQELHSALKGLKRGTIRLLDANEVPMNIEVTWDESQQLFKTTENRLRDAMSGAAASQVTGLKEGAAIAAALRNRNTGAAAATKIDSSSLKMGASEDKGATNTAIDTLNELEEQDRQGRRATHRSLAEQGSTDFLKNLVTLRPNLSIGVAHSGKVETLSKNSFSVAHDESGGAMEISEGVSESLAGAAAVSDSSAIKGEEQLPSVPFLEQPILIYGFQKPQRATMTQLKDLGFTGTRTMFMYNKGIGLEDGFGFQKYSEILLKQQTLSVSPAAAKAVAKSTTSLPLETREVIPWANYLQTHIKICDFSEQMQTPEQRMHFMLKNYTHIEYPNEISKLPEDVQDLIKNKKWTELTEYFSPVFNLLACVKDESDKSEDYKKQLYDSLLLLYDRLPEDQQAALDCMVKYAFFRKTSKLGEEFARDHDITIVSVLKVDFQTKEGDRINQINRLIEVDPTYFYSPTFRMNQGRDAPKAITFSEIERAGLIMQRMKPSDPQLRYVFMTEIKAQTAKEKAGGSRSPQKKAATGVASSSSSSAGAGVGFKKSLSGNDDEI